jgi:cation diffusion facilitator family transporter
MVAMHGDATERALMGAMTLSLGIGLLMLVMKVFAFTITGSSAIFSDAAESVVHNVAVGFALYSLWYSSRPADRSHLYGHDKISYFSAGVEGSLILLAAGFIIHDAVRKWIAGLQLENLGLGILFTAAAFVINGLLGGYLLWKGKRHNSLILEANGKHVLTDSWTSLGVIAGLLLVRFTGWLPFDPICAILVALNIIWSGGELLRRSFGGLMDEADPALDRELRRVLRAETEKRGAVFHHLRHRRAGRTAWAEVHLLFPDETPLRAAHEKATEIERATAEQLGSNIRLMTHLEPMVDHARIHGDEASADAEPR